ncbi:hypothetical protein HY772_10260 [Candidatus Woesearchaeota archaeon]|nr:hypothetical protein [Candidatus Woesearchaeota archaeon]
MRQGIVFVTLLSGLLFYAPTAASQESFSWGLNSLRNAASAMLDWFENLSQQINEIANNEERRRITVALTDLSESMYGLEQNSRYLLEALERPSVSEGEVSRYISATESSLLDVRSKLEAVGLSLREQYRAGGFEAEREISSAFGSRAGFLYELKDTIRSESPVPNDLIQQGRATLEAISAANEELLKVIGSLQT